jgi:hypothetical protein
MLESLFESKPEACPFGHKLWPGMAQVSWKPCLCAPAQLGLRSRRAESPRHIWAVIRTRKVPGPWDVSHVDNTHPVASAGQHSVAHSTDSTRHKWDHMVEVQLLVRAAPAAPAAAPYRNLDLDVLRDGACLALTGWCGLEGWLNLRFVPSQACVAALYADPVS